MRLITDTPFLSLLADLCFSGGKNEINEICCCTFVIGWKYGHQFIVKKLKLLHEKGKDSERTIRGRVSRESGRDGDGGGLLINIDEEA